MDKLKQLEIQKLLKEYDLLILNDEYKQEVIDTCTSDFMSEILGEEPNEKKEGEQKTEPKEKEEKPKIIPDEEMDAETKKIMKKVILGNVI